MLEQGTDVDRSEPSDTEPEAGYSAAPDPRRLEPLDNPISCHLLDAVSIVLTHIQRVKEEGSFAITEQKK
jgi:hypothetical protein